MTVMAYTLTGVAVLLLLLTINLAKGLNVSITPSPVATVSEGAVLWLTCTYDLGGRTLRKLQWWLRNDSRTVATVTPTAPTPCTNRSSRYSIDCDNLTSSEVRLGILNPVHGNTYQCFVYLFDTTLVQHASTQVFVIVPVTSVEIQPSAGQSLDVTENQSTRVICVTSACRPFANVFWSVGGINLTSSGVTSVQSVSGDLYITNSTLTITPSRALSGQTVVCTASNTETLIQSTRQPTLNVRHRPEILISPTSDPYVIPEGQNNVTLMCTVTSANPNVSSIVWTREVTEVSNNGVYKLPVITTGSAGVYTCSAVNDVGTTSLKITLKVTRETCPSCVEDISTTSTALLVVGVILVLIAVAVLGISIFVYRKSHLLSKSEKRKGNDQKPVKFSNVQQSKEGKQQEKVEERDHYQELDPEDIQMPNPYSCLSEGNSEAGIENVRGNYESIHGDSTTRHDYIEIKEDDDTRRYVNT